MDNKDLGRPGGLSSQATEPPSSVSALRASIPDALTEAARLLAFCECASHDGQPYALRDVANYLFDPAKRARVEDLIIAEAYLEAAAVLLPDGAIWRRYTDDSAAVYAASPYNAKAQTRYDGFSRLPAMAICAAHLRMAEASLRKAQAIEARRAETAKTGSVEDESAVGNADAPKDQQP